MLHERRAILEHSVIMVVLTALMLFNVPFLSGLQSLLQTRLGRRCRGGQAVLEYVLLFAAVAAVTLISVTAFDDNVRATLEDFFRAAANKMAAP